MTWRGILSHALWFDGSFEFELSLYSLKFLSQFSDWVGRPATAEEPFISWVQPRKGPGEFCIFRRMDRLTKLTRSLAVFIAKMSHASSQTLQQQNRKHCLHNLNLSLQVCLRSYALGNLMQLASSLPTRRSKVHAGQKGFTLPTSFRNFPHIFTGKFGPLDKKTGANR